MFFPIFFQFCTDCEVDKLLMEKSLTILRSEWGGAKWTFNESILKINHKCLTLLLEDDFLEIPEIKLFNEVISWARAACNKAGANSTDGKTLRSKLGEALKLIRFPLMPVKEFAESVVPTGILSAEEQRDILLMICGESPMGTPISVNTLPRGRKLSIDSSLKGQPYQIATSSTDKTQLQTAIRIDDFPSFVNSKAKYEAKAGTASGIRWRIVIELRKYCGESMNYITLNSSSPESAEFLGIYICSVNALVCKSFNLDVVLKFKHTRFYNKFKHVSPYSIIKTNKDILDEHYGYLTGNALEMDIEVSIS